MISSKECITQHNLIVCNLVVSAIPVKPIRIPTRRKNWRLKDTVVQNEFEQGALKERFGIYQKWTSLSCR